jgi:hypothetical protein
VAAVVSTGRGWNAVWSASMRASTSGRAIDRVDRPLRPWL